MTQLQTYFTIHGRTLPRCTRRGMTISTKLISIAYDIYRMLEEGKYPPTAAKQTPSIHIMMYLNNPRDRPVSQGVEWSTTRPTKSHIPQLSFPAAIEKGTALSGAIIIKALISMQT